MEQLAGPDAAGSNVALANSFNRCSRKLWHELLAIMIQAFQKKIKIMVQAFQKKLHCGRKACGTKGLPWQVLLPFCLHGGVSICVPAVHVHADPHGCTATASELHLQTVGCSAQQGTKKDVDCVRIPSYLTILSRGM